MGKKIVLLEFEDEAKSFLDYCKNQELPYEDFHIIALQPKVQVFLKKLNIHYENTERYLLNEEQKRGILKSEEWYKFLTDKLVIKDGSEIKETYINTFYYYLRCYFHHFLMYAEILSSICNRHEVDSIYACLYQNKIRVNTIPHIQNDERYAGIIAKTFAKNHGISWQEIPAPSIAGRIDDDKSFLNNMKRDVEKIISVLYKFFILNINRKKTILLPSIGYNIRRLAARLKNQFPDVRWVAILNEKPSKSALQFLYFKFLQLRGKPKGFIEPIPLESFTSMNAQDIENRQTLKKNHNKVVEQLQKNIGYFDYNGVNFMEIFLEKIQKDLLPYTLKIHSESLILREILDSLNVKLCISPYARETALLAAELCRHREIPTLMISHGTLKKPENKMEEIEYYHMGESLILSKFYNHVAVQFANEENICRHYKCKNTLIRTGSLIFSKPEIKNKEKYKKAILGDIDSKTKVLVYPENTRLRSTMRFHVFETFDEFLSSVCDLVNAVNNIKDVHLVIRMHPNREITTEEFKSLLPPSDNVTIASYDRPFFETLTIADMIINFSSTVIEDALHSYIPVLLYDKRGRYQHTESQKLAQEITPKPSAVYYLNDSSFVKDGLQWILDNHLKKNVSKSIFNKHVFEEDYYHNLEEFIADKINT